VSSLRFYCYRVRRRQRQGRTQRVIHLAHASRWAPCVDETSWVAIVALLMLGGLAAASTSDSSLTFCQVQASPSAGAGVVVPSFFIGAALSTCPAR